jgi:RHS repeat-associated protein
LSQTGLNYTGQRLEGTGLLYFHARYYDPSLARFVNADMNLVSNVIVC